MTDTPTLPFPARASDPWTSKAAAAGPRPTVKPRVLALLREHGPLTDEQLIDLYVLTYGPVPRGSVIKRRGELVAEGAAEPVPGRSEMSRYGHRMLLWRAA